MPELAEVEYFRKQWDVGLGRKIKGVLVHPHSRNFRDCEAQILVEQLTDATLRKSETHGKQMLFRFSGDRWLGLHLGMSGKLTVAAAEIVPARHEHFVLVQAKQALVFSDYRQFGGLRFHQGKAAPEWWSDLPPDLLTDAFDKEALKAFLARRARSPIKAVLLMQERFPGIGNWMADEILWRARIRPACPAGRIQGVKLGQLYEKIREVCREALEVIGTDWNDPPDSWLFNHRWKEGGRCPRTGKPLLRETIGGRTTCWSPAWQQWPKDV